jgi:hypothetical protein
MLETIEETKRLSQRSDCIVLARGLVKQITSISFDGTALTSEDYELDRPTGIVRRLCDDRYICWEIGKVVITYQAGLEIVPSDLKLAASKLVASFSFEAGRDPNLKREKVEGISEMEYWVGSKDDPALPSDVVDILAPYTNFAVG